MSPTTAARAPVASVLPPLRPATSRPLDTFARLREALGPRAVRTRPRAGQALLRQGEPSGRLFLLESGVVELSCVVESGRECVLDLCVAGEVFGDWSGAVLPFAAVASEGCVLMSAGRADLEIAIRRDLVLAGLLGAVANARALRLAGRLRDSLALDAGERVLATILDLADRRSTSTPEGRRVDVSITQEDLARMTGCTRETVNRTLVRLLREGRLLRRRRRYVVPSPVRR